MGAFLKVVMVLCIVGIAVVLGIVVWKDSPVQSAPSPAAEPSSAPSLTIQTTPPPSASPSPVIEDEPTGDRPAEEFRIEELTAECDDETGVFAVSMLPLGADWRTTERGVYSGSPVQMTCITAGTDDGLTYEWSSDYGEIEGSGRSVLWTAPGHGARATVAVTVQDSFGNSEKAALVFRVATCDCIFNRY